MDYEYTVLITRDEDGAYIATVPAIQGCHTAGDTEQEALDLVKEAIQLHIEARRSLGEPIPLEVATRKVRVVA